MHEHTTSIIISTYKSHIASPSSEESQAERPTSSKKKNKNEKEGKKKKGHKSSKKGGSPQLSKLPKELLRLICEYLTFEEMFVCTRLCKKLSRRIMRNLTGTKQCSLVEKADLKLLNDPLSFVDGMTFYRSHLTDGIANDDDSVCKLTMSALRTIAKRGQSRAKSSALVSNSVKLLATGQVAYHLKQLEHMVLYNTVNGNEIVRVANNWIFFNRKLFVKILDGIAAPVDTEDKDEMKFLVDLMFVEAILTRRTKSTIFGRPGNAFIEPFCEISLSDIHLRTSVASQEGEPVWNEDCSFTIGSKTNSSVQIAIYDQGRLGRHTKLGTIEISLRNLACDVLHDMWYPVIQDQDNEISGKFHVLVQKIPIQKNKEINTRTMGILGYCGPVCDSIPMRLEYGDILMISNSEFYTHIAKLGTMSVWDHIAMVVEVKKELHLFESTPDGVFTSPLNRRLKFYLKSSTLGVRRLTVGRTPEMKKALKKFIKEVDGRPYKQNWFDLVRAWKGSNTEEDLSSIFCSELVAASYKRMGLLSNEIPSNNFLPVDFAFPDNPKVKLVTGKLDKIRMIYSAHTAR